MVEKYALVDKATNRVLNIVMWDGSNAVAIFGADVTPVKLNGRGASIDWFYDGSKFIELAE